MTKQESMELAALAKELLPRTTDAQAADLAKRLQSIEFPLAKAGLRDHVRRAEDQRLNLPRVLELIAARVRAARFGTPAEAAARTRAQEGRDRRVADSSLATARAFCADLPPEQLEEWRRRIVEEGGPFLERQTKGKATLASTVLVSAIYQRFRGEAGSKSQPVAGMMAAGGGQPTAGNGA